MLCTNFASLGGCVRVPSFHRVNPTTAGRNELCLTQTLPLCALRPGLSSFIAAMVLICRASRFRPTLMSSFRINQNELATGAASRIDAHPSRAEDAPRSWTWLGTRSGKLQGSETKRAPRAHGPRRAPPPTASPAVAASGNRVPDPRIPSHRGEVWHEWRPRRGGMNGASPRVNSALVAPVAHYGRTHP